MSSPNRILSIMVGNRLADKLVTEALDKLEAKKARLIDYANSLPDGLQKESLVKTNPELFTAEPNKN